MKVLLVYAPKTKVPRRWVIPDHEAELDDPRLVQHGEASIVIDVADPHRLSHADVRRHIANHHAIDEATIPTGLCHVVHMESGEIVGATHADPDIDWIPGHLLVPTES